MAGLNFEKNLAHQQKAVESTVSVFDSVELGKPEDKLNKFYINPTFNFKSNARYYNNIKDIQISNDIEQKVDHKSNIIDIMMETGTGKTYTYTKTIFELNKNYGIFKFIIVVPTLSIKAGTIDFLRSESARAHFKEQYGKIIKLHILESKKNSKQKKAYMPSAVSSFVNSGKFEKNTIQVLIVNQGMINAKSTDKSSGKRILTLQKSYDVSLFDKHSIPFDAISATNPFMIIDEPHKFDQSNKTWSNLQKMNPQFIIRYGATFPEKEEKQKNEFGVQKKVKIKDYKNLIYQLSAVDSFNRNLVKGVIGHITEFEAGKNVLLKFTSSDGKEATFHLIESEKTSVFKISKKVSFSIIHPAMKDLEIERLNKTTVVLSNGLELKKGDKINPFSYAETLQDKMIQRAIKNHFELEREYLRKEVKIKPLTLFFIDNIKEYRDKDGSIRKTIEKYITAEVEKLLKSEDDGFYKNYLTETLSNISETHGGYFSADKKETDEVIEKEVNEILHDKQSLLDLKNKRRFIFSKWTLREGWDNPNIFQICKLRSSGSEISKLQEVGRGLRLPVNEYGNREKNEQFYLNYFVDFTENEFVEELAKEINKKSGAISREEIPEKLSDEMISNIMKIYKIDNENAFLEKLIMKHKVIDFSKNFINNGFEYIKANYPLIFHGVDSNKIRKAKQEKKKVSVRIEKYDELKTLWEKLNEKVILEYKIKNESEFQEYFLDFLNSVDWKSDSPSTKKSQIQIEDNKAIIREENSIYKNETSVLKTLDYDDFLKQLSLKLKVNIKTIHDCFILSNININNYLNQSTIRNLKTKFDNYLMYQALNKFSIEYKKVSSLIHPTKITDKAGKVRENIDSADIGVLHSNEKVAENYLFDKLFYDSELEKENIKENINEVIVFSKIPKNSIRIPIAGGKSYSPDFAYVVNFKNGENKVNFVIETKDADNEGLRNEEYQKIKHAEKLFDDKIKIKFKTQFKNDKIIDLIKKNGF
jgi:type III restriction enzyme